MSGPDAIPLRRTPTDLVTLLTGTIETLQQQARALDVVLAIDAQPGLPEVRVDAEKIAAYNMMGRNKRSIVLNLREQEARDIFYRLADEHARVVLDATLAHLRASHASPATA